MGGKFVGKVASVLLKNPGLLDEFLDTWDEVVAEKVLGCNMSKVREEGLGRVKQRVVSN